MRRLEPLKGIRRWLHRKCALRVRGDLFVLGELALGNSLLVVEGSMYILSSDEADRVKRAMGVGTIVTGGTFTVAEGSLNAGSGTIVFDRERP